MLALTPPTKVTAMRTRLYSLDELEDIPGTKVFTAIRSRQAYHLHKFCMSLMDAANRDAFVRDEAAYIDKFQLTPEQRAAVAARNVLQMIAAGGNIYYLAKLAGILGLNVQDVGAQQTGMSVEAFKQMLLDQAKSIQNGETVNG